MKLGIFGAGMIVHDFLSMYQQVDDLKIVYICATPQEEEKLKELCVQYNIPKYYIDIDKAFSDSDADTCYIGVPNYLHYTFVKKALYVDRHVICEKPLTSNIKEANELADIAKKRGKILVEGVSTYYFPNMSHIKSLIPTLGDIKLVVINFSSYSTRYDRFKNGEMPPAFDYNKAGGALMDLNIYNISFIVCLFGKPKDIEYYANVERKIDTSGVLILDYGTFKCVLVAAKDCKAPVTGSIQGDKKCILLNGPVNMLLGFKVMDAVGRGLMENDRIYENYNDPQKHRMYYEFIEFVRMVKENDLNAAYNLLELSLITMDIQTKARKKAGITFPTD